MASFSHPQPNKHIQSSAETVSVGENRDNSGGKSAGSKGKGRRWAWGTACRRVSWVAEGDGRPLRKGMGWCWN